MTGSFHNLAKVAPGHDIGAMTIGNYHESGNLNIQLSGISIDPLQYDVLHVAGSLILDPESILELEFYSDFDEAELTLGDSFDIIHYLGMCTGQFGSIDESLAGLIDGIWTLEYNHDLGGGLYSIRLVYSGDLSSVEGSSLPQSLQSTNDHCV